MKKCKAFYIGEKGQMLSKHVHGHRSICMVVNSDLLVPIHTQSHQLPFQAFCSVLVIHKLPEAIPNHVHRQYEMAYHLSLKPTNSLESTFDSPKPGLIYPITTLTKIF